MRSSDNNAMLFTSTDSDANQKIQEDEADAIQLTFMQNRLENLTKIGEKRPLNDEEKKEHDHLSKKIKIAAIKETENLKPKKRAKSNQPYFFNYPSVPSNFSELPAEIKEHIFSYLESEDLTKLSVISKEWRKILQGQHFWKLKLKLNNFPVSLFSQCPIEKIDYKAMYLKYFTKAAAERLAPTLERFYLILTNYKALSEVEPLISEPIDIYDKYEMFTEYYYIMCQCIKDLPVDFLDLTYYYLQKYPEVNKQYNCGQTLLHLAIALLHPKAVEYLVCHQKADLEVKNFAQYTPLMSAAFINLESDEETEKSNCRAIGECLINNGADVTVFQKLDEDQKELLDNPIISSLITDINNPKLGG